MGFDILSSTFDTIRPSFINDATVEAVDIYRAHKNIDRANDILKSQAHADIGFEKAKKLALLHDELDHRKSGATISFVRDDDGHILIVNCRPRTDNTVERMIKSHAVNVKCLCVNRFVCSSKGGLPDLIRISWLDGKNESSLFLIGNEINASTFWSRLSSVGVYMCNAGKSEKNIRHILFSWLLRSASTIEIPRSCGWTQTQAGHWVFVEKGQLTYVDSIMTNRGAIYG